MTDSLNTIAYLGLLYNKRKMIQDTLNAIRRILNAGSASTAERYKLGAIFYQFQIDSMAVKAQSDSAYYTYKAPDRYKNMRKLYKDSIDKEILALELAAPVSKVNMWWVTPRIALGRKKFYLYDSLETYDAQVTDTAFASSFIGGELSYYRWAGADKLSY